MELETIDVTGLPEQVIEGIQNLVASIRNNLSEANRPKASANTVTLPRWEGTVLGPLNRRELYEDVG